MGNGATTPSTEPIDRKDSWLQDRHDEFEYVHPKKLWHRNKEDLLAAEALCMEEEEILKKKKLSPHEIQAHMRIYRKGVIHMRDAMVDIMRKELIPANERAGFDPDYWFEINLTNYVLFPQLDLDKIGELLPGRLFTTRMPRNIKNSPDSAAKFKEKKEKYNLDTALILTEKEEYAKYAGADLEAFYKSIGINVINRPIVDFGIPDQKDIIKDIKDITWQLANGKNVLVHCAGGNGRTGMVIAAVVKSVGVKNPIQFIRRVKSIYVETKEQEEFVASIPAVIDSKISLKYPELGAVIALGTLQQAQKQHTAKSSAMRMIPTLQIAASKGWASKYAWHPTSVDELGLTPEQIVDYSATFDLYNVDENDFISVEELAVVLKAVGCSTPATELFKGIDRDNDGQVSKFEFFLAMGQKLKP